MTDTIPAAITDTLRRLRMETRVLCVICVGWLQHGTPDVGTPPEGVTAAQHVVTHLRTPPGRTALGQTLCDYAETLPEQERTALVDAIQSILDVLQETTP